MVVGALVKVVAGCVYASADGRLDALLVGLGLVSWFGLDSCMDAAISAVYRL